jgi:hypothetical protein
MKLIRNACAATLLAAVSLVACSTQQGTTGTTGTNSPVSSLPNGTSSNGLGSFGMHLQIGNGVVLQSLNWQITGTGLPTYNGNVPIGDAQSIEFEQGGIQAGSYTITFTGTDSNSDPCTGTGTFTIVAGSTTYAVVTITCTQPADASYGADVTTGTLAVDAGVILTTAAAYNCPGISSFSINPAEVFPPQTAALSVATIVTPGGTPGTSTINWSTTGGTFVDTGTASSSLTAPTLNCGAFTGTAVVTVTIGLTGSNNGVDAGDVCASAPYQTISGNVVCEAGGTTSCFAPTPNLCPASGGNPAFCTNFTDTASTCGGCTAAGSSPLGVVCPAAETCQSGVCACPTAGQSLCSGACVALNTTTNCGTCGNACAAGDTCTGGVCTVPPPTICPATGTCPANSITCPTEASGNCNGTEQIIVQRDEAQGLTTAAGSAAANSNSCFACLAGAGCIDWAAQGQHGFDCEDTTTSFTGNGGAAPFATLCDNTLSCVTGSTGAACAENSEGVAYCYCGTEGGATSATCQGTASPFPLNGSCATQEYDGFNYTGNASLVTGIDNTSQPSGVANQIISCAKGNGCTMCY